MYQNIRFLILTRKIHHVKLFSGRNYQAFCSNSLNRINQNCLFRYFNDNLKVTENERCWDLSLAENQNQNSLSL